jgi:UDP-N-acetylmuramyl pentapeptide phosphotransferase/UDP-N-acetylglucosamine-1-phosphate transferase
MGGIGILAGFLVPIAILLVMGPANNPFSWLFRRDLLTAVLAGFVLGGAGICDDLRRLTAFQKFSVQLIFAVGVMTFGIPFAGSGIAPDGESIRGGLVALASILWLIGFTNFFNFMDGVDGMAGGAAVIYGGFLSCFAFQQQAPGACLVSLLAVGASLGFLTQNFPSARTFMGDEGSLFLGMLFAVMSLGLFRSSRDPAIILSFLLLYSVVFYDCSLTIMRRLIAGENIFRAHRSHLYQRLVQHGWSHPEATFLYLSLTLLGGILGVICPHVSPLYKLVAVGADAMGLAGLTVLVHTVEKRAARTVVPADVVSTCSAKREAKRFVAGRS